MIVIGITGTLGAGKGTIAEYLVKKGFRHFSVREYLTGKLRETNSPINRNTLVALGNNLRSKHGFSFVTDQVHEQASKSEHDCVIESFRHPEEIKALKARGNFYLFSVNAPIETRYKRIKKRSNETDKISFDEFKEHEERELDPKKSSDQNLITCMQLADYSFKNISTMASLYKDVNKAVKDILAKRKSFYSRPTWDQYFMEVANSISKRATCDRGRSGCVIARDKQVLCSGYVGSPIGFPHCDDVGHQIKKTIHEDGTVTEHCVRTVHAEQNALCQAAKSGVSVDGATVYCRMTPCRTCAMLLINSGIKRIYCEKKYHAGTESEEMFKKAGVKVEFQNEEVQKY